MTVENLHDAIGQLPSDLIAKVDAKRCRKPKVISLRRYAAMAACLAVILGGTFLFTQHFAPKNATEQMAAAPAEAAPAAVAPEIGAEEEEAAMDSAKIAASPEPTEASAAGTGSDDGVCGLPTAPAMEADAESTVLYLPYPINIPATQYAETRNIGTGCTTSEPVIRVLRSLTELEEFRENFGYYDLEDFDACCEIYDESWFEQHDLLVVLMKALSANASIKVTSMLDLDNNGIWELCISYDTPYEDTTKRTDRFVLMEAEKDAIADKKSVVIILE